MSQTSPESQLKEALAALGELKSLAEGFKAQTEAKAQTEERISKAEQSIEGFKTLLASIGEKVDTLAARSRPDKAIPDKDFMPAAPAAGEVVDGNEIGGVNKTIVKTKKKKQPLAAEGEEDMEDEEEEDEEKMSKKGRGNCGKDKGPRAAEAEEEEDMEDEEEETEAKGKKAKKAGIPPQFLKNIKKKKEEMEDEESEPKAEEAEEGEEDEEEEVMSKKSKKAKKAAEPMEDEEEEDEEDTEKMSKKKGKKASEEVVTPSAETNESETKAEETPVQEVFDPPMPANPVVAEAVASVAQETPAPKAEEVPAAVTEIEALKAKIASEAKAREEALAQVTKMQADFQNLSELIAKYEASQKSAEEKVAKTVAQMGVEPVASSPAAEAEAVQTPDDIIKEYASIKDAKAAREFYLKHEETIRAAAFGMKRRNA